MKNYIDSHFHILSIIDKGINIPNLFKDLDEDGFYGGIDIGTLSYDFNKRYEIIKTLKNIKASIGSGPWQLTETLDISYMISELEKTLKKNKDKIIAVGEFGLDYYYNYATKEKQWDLAKEQIKLANYYKLPVILHNRDANRDFEKLLNKYPPNTTILHCFSGDTHLADFAKERLMYLSFSCNITYKRNQELRDIAKSYLPNRLLLETDSPYLSPQIRRGKVNTPFGVKESYKLLSELREINIEDILSMVLKNYKDLFE